MANSIILITRQPDTLIEALDAAVAARGETRSAIVGQALAAELGVAYQPRERGRPKGKVEPESDTGSIGSVKKNQKKKAG